MVRGLVRVYWGLDVALVPIHEFFFVCGTNVTSQIKSHGILTARFEYHFSGQNGPTLNARKIDNFYPRHLKLRDRVFQTMNFSTVPKKNSCHMHYKFAHRRSFAPCTKPLSPLFRSVIFSRCAPTNWTPGRGYISKRKNTMPQHKEAHSNQHILPFWTRNDLPDDWESLD